VFERFTEPARRVVILAQEEARALGHDRIGTEHLLLGLLREEEGVARRALRALGISADGARARIVDLAGRGEHMAAGDLGFTAPARRALELASRDAERLRDRHVSTEHLLMGLTREHDTVAARVLADLAGSLTEVRVAIEREAEGGRPMSGPAPPAGDASELGLALQRAAALADGGRPVDGADLLVGLSEAGGVAAAALAELGVDRARLRQAVTAARRGR
jgi:ATP-dependent Clp protease ATP-binding subunit ClpC